MSWKGLHGKPQIPNPNASINFIFKIWVLCLVNVEILMENSWLVLADTYIALIKC